MFINDSGTIGKVFIFFTTNITGSIMISMLLLFVLAVAIFLAFRVPIDLSVILLLPLVIVFLAFESQFLIVGGLIIIWLGILLARTYVIGG